MKKAGNCINFKTKPDCRNLRLAALTLTLAVTAACTGRQAGYNGQGQQAHAPTQQPAPSQAPSAKPDFRPLAATGSYRAGRISGDYADYASLERFIDYMTGKHGFSREYLYGVFSQAKRRQWTLDYLNKSDQSLKSPPGKGSWSRYRAKFLDERHISSGVAFWQKHKHTLERASRQYGVPAEYILGIMAVETTFGSFVGKDRILDALTTLAFDYQRRGEYFRGELENFLVMARSEHLDPVQPVGSYAGAMGLGQFMPGSFLAWAVDFNGDGRRDLWNPEDSIGSIANYFSQHGWQAGQPIVSAIQGYPNGLAALELGLNTTYTPAELQKLGVIPAKNCSCDGPLRLLLLRHQHGDEYLIGFPNFYVITRYNQSTHYAMAVHELAQAIKLKSLALAAN